MLSSVVFKGYVRSYKDIEGKTSNGLQLSLSVNTPEKKPEDGYPPSLFVQVTFWGQQAESARAYLEKYEPKAATITGDMITPYLYDKDGTPSCIMRVNGNRIVFDAKGSDDSDSSEKSSSKTSAKSSTKEKAKKKEDSFDAEEFGFTDS